jgi:exodeoxyribonuclease VII small subunit
MTKTIDQPSYRDLKADLDDVLMRLQSSELDIDEALELFQRGQELVKQLEKYLSQTENTIKKLKVNLDD